MKKMYFLKDRKEAVIDRLTYMSKHRQEYLQDKEHGMITLQFKQGMPVIRFSSGRVTSYWDFSFDGKKMTVQRRCSLSDKIIWVTLLIIDCNGVQREHNKKLNNGLPILHKVPPKRDYGRYFCIMAEKGGTSHGGLTEKLSPFFHAKKQEVNAYGR